MTLSKQYEIKLASFHDIQRMISWAKNEGWNPGLQDAFAFQFIDPNGFFIGYLQDEPVSCISLVKYQPEYAFLGLYIVSPSYRGQGLGSQIWQHAMHYGQTCSVIGLDGVLAQQNRYSQLGFQLAYKNIRYALEKNIYAHFNHPQLIDINDIPLTKIFAYDKKGFHYKRDAFLTAWLLMSNAKALAYSDNQQIKGYGVIRECHSGYKVGPLFADNAEIATILFQGLCSTIQKQDQAIFIDIPEANMHSKPFLENFSMQAVFEVARMYYGNVPTLSLNHVFGFTTYEVG